MFDMEKDTSDTNMMEIVREGIVETITEEVLGGRSIDDPLIACYMPAIFGTPKEIDFIKAIGIASFQDDKEKCLVINDFCAVLSDMLMKGKEEMKR